MSNSFQIVRYFDGFADNELPVFFFKIMMREYLNRMHLIWKHLFTEMKAFMHTIIDTYKKHIA